MEANFRVGQYVLEKPLGEGGMAEVWLGRNVHLGTPAAVKFLSQAFAGVKEIEQRFLNEGRRQGSLNHPNIIKVYGFEYVDNRSFLILQFIDGEALDAALQRVGRLEPPEGVRIAISMLNALDCAHEHSIVHRDIKPSNILLDENRIPYLGDFGIVLATNEKRLTRTGTAMGTALYMSPEQINDPGSVDRRSDIYSFGCVLYEMLTGEPPFNPASTGQGDTDFAVKLAHVQQAPAPLRQRNPSLAPELEAVVMRCLAKKPGDRYSTCRETRDALVAAMVARPFSARAQTPPPVAPPQERASPRTPPPTPSPTPAPPPTVPPPVAPQVAQFFPQAHPSPSAQTCPNCRREVYPGAPQCPHCGYRLSYGPAIAPAAVPYIQARVNSKASNARTCGILALVFTIGVNMFSRALSPYDRRGISGLIGILLIAGIILGIVAIVKGNGVKRTLALYRLDPVLRGRANAGVVMGWIAVGFFGLILIAYASR